MSLRCKPGDLAVIVSAKHPENVGMFVDVLEYAGDGPLVEYGGGTWLAPGPSWIVRARHGEIVSTGTVIPVLMRHKERPCPDDQLQPIRPPAKDTTTTQTKEKVHESS